MKTFSHVLDVKGHVLDDIIQRILIEKLAFESSVSEMTSSQPIHSGPLVHSSLIVRYITNTELTTIDAHLANDIPFTIAQQIWDTRTTGELISDIFDTFGTFSPYTRRVLEYAGDHFAPKWNVACPEYSMEILQYFLENHGVLQLGQRNPLPPKPVEFSDGVALRALQDYSSSDYPKKSAENLYFDQRE